jgi:hypothetical protein
MPQIELISNLCIGGAESILPEGITLIHKTNYHEFSVEEGAWQVLQVVWNTGIPPSLIAACLYEVIKQAAQQRANHHPKRIQINRTWIDFDQGEMVRRIEECVEFSE